MDIRRSLAAVALLAALCGSTACATYNPQRIDNLATAACRDQMLRGIEQVLVGNHESPAVARTLAVSAVDQMGQEIPDAPRPNSHLAADLRVLTTDAKVGSNSGTVYDIYADRNDQGCTLRVTSSGLFIRPAYPLPACNCEPAQD